MIDRYPYAAQFTKETFSKYLDSALIVFDTNVLLQLYRLTSNTRHHILNILKHKRIQNHLWAPSVVVEEYLKNRGKIIRDSIKRFDEMYQNTFGVKGFFATYINRNEEDAELKKEVGELLKKEIDELSSYLTNDIVFSELDLLYPKKRIGKMLTKDEKISKKKEYDERLSANIDTPGEKDKNKDENQEGDFLIWELMMDEAKEKKQDVIFVTRDRKTDWWLKTNSGEIIEKFTLLKDFYDSTEQQIRMFEDVAFFELLAKYGIIDEGIKQTVITLQNEKTSIENYDNSKMIEEMQKLYTNQNAKGLGEAIMTGSVELSNEMKKAFNALKMMSGSLNVPGQPLGGLLAMTDLMKENARLNEEIRLNFNEQAERLRYLNDREPEGEKSEEK